MSLRIAVYIPQDQLAGARLASLMASLETFGVRCFARSARYLISIPDPTGYVEPFDAAIALDSDPYAANIDTFCAAAVPAIPVIKLKAGSLASITKTDAGSGYTGAPTLSFSGGGGTGAAATCTVNAGAIDVITITNAGKGYTSAPTCTVTPTNGGTGAVLTPVLDTAGLKFNTVDADDFTLAQVTDGTLARWIVARSLTPAAADASVVLDPMAVVS